MKIHTKQAIELAGSAPQLAAILGLTKSAVYFWGEYVPDERVKQLLELRPSWFPNEAAQLANNLRVSIEKLELIEPIVQV